MTTENFSIFQNNSFTLYGNITLTQLEWSQFVNYSIPAIAFLIVLSIFGVFGNTHILMVFTYYSKSSVTVLVRWMAVADLLTAVVCIPLEIVQIRFTYTYPSRSLCKITRYLTYLSALSSGFLLLSVAIERRQKICYPLNQLSIMGTKRLILCVTAVCASVSIPAALSYDADDRSIVIPHVEGITRRHCRDKKNVWVTKYYLIIVTCIIFVVFIICAIAYLQIVNVIRKQMKESKKRFSLKKQTSKMRQTFPDVKHGQMKLRESMSRQPTQQYRQSQKLTLILLLGTFVSFLGYLLHLLANIIKTIINKGEINEMTTFFSIYTVFVRGYCLHCAVNPLIYVVVDKKFLARCINFYSTVLCKIGKTSGF